VGIVYGLQQAGVGAVCTPHLRPGDRVLLIGDSLAVGLKTPMRELAARSGCEFGAFAESGTTMKRWLGDGQVTALLQSYRPTLVMACLGTNDSKGNTPDETLALQVGQMREWLTSTGAHLLWIAPPKLPFPERVSKLVVAAGIDSFPSAALPIPQPDGIHTSGRGYAGWAEHVFAYLSCNPAPSTALAGLGAAPWRPVVPSFMVRARPPRTASGPRKRGKKKKRRV
jgi:hypothetical protein